MSWSFLIIYMIWMVIVKSVQRAVIHIQHTSDQPHSLFHPANEGYSFKEIAKLLDEEMLLQKKVNSSFIGTNLEEQLRSNEIDTVVIAGLTTPHCTQQPPLDSQIKPVHIMIQKRAIAFHLQHCMMNLRLS